METKTKFTRKELYEEVWKKPISELLTTIDTTRKTFNTICHKHDIPLPPNRYWQKIRFGKSIEKTPLPTRKDNNEIIDFKKNTIVKDSPSHKLNLLKKEIKSSKSLPLIVPEKLSKPDPLIKAAKQDLKNKKESHLYTLEGLITTSEGIFNIYASKEMIKRALIFSDSLIKLIKRRGHKVIVSKDNTEYNKNGTILLINEEAFHICVRENRKRVYDNTKKYSWDRMTYQPTGILSLRIDESRPFQWSDSTKKTLEEKLPDILAYLEHRASEEKIIRAEREEYHRKYEEQKRKAEEFKLNRREQLNEFKQAFQEAERWRRCKDLRAYLEALKSNANNKGSFDNDLKRRLDWLKEKIDWYDPFIEKHDELFKDVDRNTLELKEKKFW